MVEADVVDNADTRSTTIGEIDGIGIAVLVRHVIDQEVVDAVVKVAVGADRMNQFVDVEVADETQVGIAVAVVVDDMGFVGDKVTKQRAGEQPFAHGGSTAFDVAERNFHQTELCLVAVEGGTVHREVDDKSL